MKILGCSIPHCMIASTLRRAIKPAGAHYNRNWGSVLWTSGSNARVFGISSCVRPHNCKDRTVKVEDIFDPFGWTRRSSTQKIQEA
jgi:hypothetical protein